MKDYRGNIYGKLTVIDNLPNKKRHLNKVTAKCECGNIKDFYLSNIVSGKTSSCGCINRQKSSERYKILNLSHGLANHPLYTIYHAMMNRCYNENDISYKRYGGKGVTVCDEWRNDFMKFFEWAMNYRWREGLQLDKDILGNGKLYSPDTCKFVSRSENCRNRSTNKIIQYNGESKTLSEWCEKTGLNHTCILHRLKRGWSIEKTLNTPAKNNGYAKA